MMMTILFLTYSIFGYIFTCTQYCFEGFVRAKDFGLLNITIGFALHFCSITTKDWDEEKECTISIFRFHQLVVCSFVAYTRSGFVILLNPFLPVDICVYPFLISTSMQWEDEKNAQIFSVFDRLEIEYEIYFKVLLSFFLISLSLAFALFTFPKIEWETRSYN